jgi:lipid-A-disaccharide synthase
VLLSVGDASGDVIASDFVRELRSLRPGVQLSGLGGPEMARAGVDLIVDQSEMATGGLVELLPELPQIVSAWRRMKATLMATRPDLVVLVDSSGFNLPFAKQARRLGIPTLYYVSPQVWGWRTGRIKKLAARVTQLAVIFPFEVDVYAGTGVPVEFVGHPLAERLAEAREKYDPGTLRASLSLAQDATVVALLPGSRRSEMRHLLPLQLEIAQVLLRERPDLRFVIPRASTVAKETLEAGIAAAGFAPSAPFTILEGRAHELLAGADVALCKPGTSTLEAAILGCPTVVAARTNTLTAWLVKRLIRVDSLVMPNLIAGEPIVPEFLQEDAEPERVARAVLDLLEPEAGEAQRAALQQVRDQLNRGGAARRAAEIASRMIVERLAP